MGNARVPIFVTSHEVLVETSRGVMMKLPPEAHLQVMSLWNLPYGMLDNFQSFDNETEAIVYCAHGYCRISRKQFYER